MIFNDNWRLLDWGYVCDQSPGVQAAYNRADDDAEYGVNFFEFINTTDGLSPHIQEWWNSLSADRQTELLRERKESLSSLVGSITDVLGG